MTCRHHWIIQPALDFDTLEAEALPGRCRYCGAERVFRNLVEPSWKTRLADAFVLKLPKLSW
jgi:hypothetical protein